MKMQVWPHTINNTEGNPEGLLEFLFILCHENYQLSMLHVWGFLDFPCKVIHKLCQLSENLLEIMISVSVLMKVQQNSFSFTAFSRNVATKCVSTWHRCWDVSQSIKWEKNMSYSIRWDWKPLEETRADLHVEECGHETPTGLECSFVRCLSRRSLVRCLRFWASRFQHSRSCAMTEKMQRDVSIAACLFYSTCFRIERTIERMTVAFSINS